MKLYEISKDIALLEAMLEQQEAPLEEAQSFLNELKGTKAEKVENCVALLKNWAALEEAIKAEEAALRARRESLEKRAEWLKNYLSFCLPPGEKYETARCKITWRKSESVEIVNEESVPEIFTEEVVTRKINKVLIKAALKSGEEVSGVKLIKRNNLVIK